MCFYESCLFLYPYLGPKLQLNSLALPPPSNPKVEKMINDANKSSMLFWNGKSLTDTDMTTIAHYLLRDNKVSLSPLRCSIKTHNFLFLSNGIMSGLETL